MIEVRLEPSLLIAGEHNAVTILVTNSSPATCSRIIVKLSFPSDLILTEGSPSIEVQRLAGGRSSEHRIGIRPRRAGTWTVTTPNFSFRNEWDEPRRIKGCTHGLEAVSRPVPEPTAAPSAEAPRQGDPGPDGVFISYRRTRTSMHADLIDHELVLSLGRNRVFRDVASLEPGQHFRRVIVRTIESSGVVLVLIGQGWLRAADEVGRRRLDLPGDLVRIEIETALSASHVRTIPVLCDGVSMPRADALPPSIRGLVDLHAAHLESTEHARHLALRVVNQLS